jgi:acyl-CoA thioester hydrolase
MTDDADRQRAQGRETYPHFQAMQTRWIDNDVYGHMNNVNYYALFDTVVNQHLMEQGVLDPRTSAAIGLVVDTRCVYFRPISFPQRVDAGLRVARLGRASVRYEIGLYRDDEVEPAAAGHFVHVYVERASRASTPIPDDVRAVLERLTVA